MRPFSEQVYRGLQGGVRRLRRLAAPGAAAPVPPTAIGMAAADMLFSIAVAEGRYSDPLALGRCHAQVYSQGGEDGIIAEVFRRIGARDRFFVEIGIGDGLENNTRLLLEQGWRGVWLDGGDTDAVAASFRDFVADGALTIRHAFITRENIEALLDQGGVPPRFDFLSLDIDRNTSHVWRALGRRSRVACIEYNASLPAAAALEVPYEATAGWEGTNWFGASLKVLERIGADKHMHLVGCDLLGFNAFFVDADETAGRFRAPFTAEAHWEPARYRAIRPDPAPPSPEPRRWTVLPQDRRDDA